MVEDVMDSGGTIALTAMWTPYGFMGVVDYRAELAWWFGIDVAGSVEGSLRQRPASCVYLVHGFKHKP